MQANRWCSQLFDTRHDLGGHDRAAALGTASWGAAHPTGHQLDRSALNPGHGVPGVQRQIAGSDPRHGGVIVRLGGQQCCTCTQSSRILLWGGYCHSLSRCLHHLAGDSGFGTDTGAGQPDGCILWAADDHPLLESCGSEGVEIDFAGPSHIGKESRLECPFQGKLMYTYDIFVSYRRERSGRENLIAPWLGRVVRTIEHYVGLELGDCNPRVFFDQESIEVGENWPERLREALLKSKCLLPIWTPQYFNSRWCMAEWQSFVAREEFVRGDAHDSHCRLIIPIQAHDGNHYPKEAQDTQQFDLRRYYATTKAFWRTERADKLDQLLADLARKIAQVIIEAPDYSDDWPVKTPEPLSSVRGMRMVRM
jgi:hypothetical protein